MLIEHSGSSGYMPDEEKKKVKQYTKWNLEENGVYAEFIEEHK